MPQNLKGGVVLVKEKAVNPWGELYEFLTGKDKLNFALEPEMRVLYTAIRDFSAHCAIFDSATPSSMAPKNELPLLLVASHCLQTEKTPEAAAHMAIASCSLGRLHFYCQGESWNPEDEALHSFIGRMYPTQVQRKVMPEADPRVISVWKKILQEVKEKQACVIGGSSGQQGNKSDKSITNHTLIQHNKQMH
jgi:hypothetical protein|uniref:hypothetical protein n=1 Tax=Aeromonas salmonicida TaxID=645 RepID=UPI00339B2686